MINIQEEKNTEDKTKNINEYKQNLEKIKKFDLQ